MSFLQAAARPAVLRQHTVERVMVAETHGPAWSWRVAGALTIVVLSLGLGSAASAAEQPTLTVDQHKAQYVLGEVVDEVHDACAPHPDQHLHVTVREPSYEFSVAIVCSAALSDPAQFIEGPLVAEAARHQRVGARARAVGDAYDALPPVDGVGYDHDGTVWEIAAHDPARCRTAENPKIVRSNMVGAIQSTKESAAHWTLVEALWVMGACPERLPALYESVAALGNPTAAQTVERIMARKPVTLPLASVPRGVSARAVDGRQVFLERDGRHVRTFLTDVHHLPGERTLWYCPQDHVFASPLHAELFDETGAIVGGPAQRGLDRFRTTVAGDVVTVHLADIVHGTTARSTTPAPAGAAAAGWDTDPRSFCFQAVKNTVTPFG